ncbi:uncharacterized protein LOC134280199 [Saccostrea cucullata]|uniref:uncharacterized protein LOC134280199 n=1 Tax=Saccostrea cuccullata TaxID=36930 RepID=UPI002ED38D3A
MANQEAQTKVQGVIASRQNVIRKLKELRDEIQKEDKRLHIGKIVYSSTSIISGGLSNAGLVLIPFTSGVSLVLTIVGAATDAASGIADIGHSTAAYIKIKKKSGEAERVLKRHRSFIDELEDMVKKEKFGLSTGVTSVSVVKNITNLSLKSVTIHAIRTSKAVDAVETVATSIASTSSKSLSIAGGVLAVIFIVKDIKTIFDSSRKLAYHVLHEKVAALNSVIARMEFELRELMTINI